MKIAAIIQGRMTSTRLPGKIMSDVAGRPLIHHVVERAQRAKTLNLTIFATTDLPSDDVVADFCREYGIPFFRGSEDDVLDRYYRAAESFGVDVIVRLTADCPLLDPEVIDKVVCEYINGDYDYVSNTLEPTFPDGLDTEVFSRKALERAWHDAKLLSEREHVTPYIWKNPGLFHLKSVRCDQDCSGLRWTVDRKEDLGFVRRVYDFLGPSSYFGMRDVIGLMDQRPELKDINADIMRNEGFTKSVLEDRRIDEKGK